MSIDKITIYKIKDTATVRSDFLKVDGVPKNITLPARAAGVPVSVWAHVKTHTVVRKTQDNIPWLAFFNEGLNAADHFRYNAQNSFPSGVVVVQFEVAGTASFYALTFGLGGENLIDHEYIVRDFGLQVAMNICDPDNLKRIQTSMHEAVSTQSERQISVGSSFSVFNIDDEKEFFRAVAGAAKAEFDFVQSFNGRDSIAIKARKGNALNWRNLVDRVEMLANAYDLEDFKTNFPGYAKFRFENDPIIIAELDSILFNKIRGNDLANIHLAAPEVMDFNSVEFSYNKEAERYDDLVLSELLAARRAFGDRSSIDSLKGMRIQVWNVDTQAKMRDWSGYKCMVAEVERGNESYILSNAQWKQVASDFKTEVDNYMATITVSTDGFLLSDVRIWHAVSGKNKESVFNAEVAAATTDVLLFDTAKIEIAGQRYYETCDIFHKERKFVQVKRFSSGSASVSHLFVQGRFYAEAFLSDDNCRQGMRNHVDEIAPVLTKDVFLALIPLARKEVVSNSYTVVFCILGDNDGGVLADLPFMARYELMHTHKHLTNGLGMNCEVAFRKVLTGAEPTP
jgi:uncharacterized protein (TIGR04141 family)